MIPELNAQLGEETLSQIIEEASQAFWSVIAKSHPHIKTGDLDPGSVFAFENAATSAVKTWLAFNAPGGVLPDNPDSLLAERIAKAKTAFKGYEFFTDNESDFLCEPIRLSGTWDGQREHCVVNTVIDTRDRSGQSTLDFVVEFCPGTISIQRATAYAQNGSVVGEDHAVRFFSTTSPDNIEVSNASYEDAHEAKWSLMSKGILAQVVDADGHAIPESDPVLAANDRLCQIIADLDSQGRTFHLDDDPAEIVTPGGTSDEGRIFNDAEAAFLRKELSTIREVLGNDQLWDTASPFLGIAVEEEPLQKQSSGPRLA
jgi:hypothetical protein